MNPNRFSPTMPCTRLGIPLRSVPGGDGHVRLKKKMKQNKNKLSLFGLLFRRRDSKVGRSAEKTCGTLNQATPAKVRNEDKMTKTVTPSTKETAFSCPHCGAFTTQYWYTLYAEKLPDKNPTPFIPSEADKDRFKNTTEIPQEQKKEILEWFTKMITGLVDLEYHNKSTCCYDAVQNLHLTQCYNCKKFAVWVHSRLLFPAEKTDVAPNPDIPPDIVRDFEEAREIADASPRGAAALLRLCIQKMCSHLGEKGKNIDDDIGSLVKKGLNPLVQQSLDIVRVIGNEAVHPGVIDLKDDRDTAMTLFQLLNAIADQMISHPKTVQAMYDKLPEMKREAIEKRDGKSRKPDNGTI